MNSPIISNFVLPDISYKFSEYGNVTGLSHSKSIGCKRIKSPPIKGLQQLIRWGISTSKFAWFFFGALSTNRFFTNKQGIENSDRVLAPSTGPDELTIPGRNSLDVKIEQQRGSAVKRAANIFLSKWKSPNPKHSFRNLVKAIIQANRWKIPLIIKEESTEELHKSYYDERSGISFNLNAFKTAGTGNAGLSKRAKYILTKNPWERTDDEMEILYSVVNQMKCFSKYSSLVRHELATVINLETYEDGRVIIQEGYQGISMYFIVSGTVVVQVSHLDVRTGDKKYYVVGEITAGSSFGELALIQECKRTATIVCKGTSQFLRVDKQDFDMVLRRSYEQEWSDRLNMVKSITFFSDWTEADLRHITLNCFVQEFQPETIILGNTSEVTDRIYFVVSGICDIVRQVNILVTTSHLGGQTMLSLPRPNELKDPNHKIKTRFLRIGHLFPGDFFGVGENLKSCFILTLCRVECLLVPRHAVAALERVSCHAGQDIYKKFTIADMLSQVQSRLLSEKKVFEKWMANLRWKNYKKKIVNDIFAQKSSFEREHSYKPFRLKSFQIEDKFPSLNSPLSANASPVYQVPRRGGFININHVQLPPIEGSEDTKIAYSDKRKSLYNANKPSAWPPTRTRTSQFDERKSVASTISRVARISDKRRSQLRRHALGSNVRHRAGRNPERSRSTIIDHNRMSLNKTN